MKKYISILLLALIGIDMNECAAQLASSNPTKFGQPVTITGADQTEKYLSYLKGKRIGPVANQSSVIGSVSSVDSLLKLQTIIMICLMCSL